MRTIRRYAILAVLLWGLASVFHQAPAIAVEGPIEVKEIAVEGLNSIERGELLYLLDLKEGGTTDDLRVRRGIKRAFLKGIFHYISVESDDTVPGRIIVRVKEKDVITGIDFNGLQHVSESFVDHALILKRRTFMRYDLLDKAGSDLEDELMQKGYPDARVDISVVRADEPYKVRLEVDVKEGAPIIVRHFDIVGAPESAVLPYLKLKPGDVYDQYRLRESLDRIVSRYKKAHHLDPVAGPYTFSNGTLAIKVSPGTRLDVNVVGNTAVSMGDILDVLPFEESGEFRDDLVEDAATRIVYLYHEKGYPFAQVAPVVDTDEKDIAKVTFFVFEGEKVKVRSITFEGVSLPTDNLKRILSLREGKAYDPDALGDDASSVHEFYIALGYLDAKVDEPEVSISGTSADITLHVTEGQMYTIGTINVEGIEPINRKEALSVLNIEDGGIYNEMDIIDARYRLIDLCSEHGYPDCSVEARNSFEDKVVNLVFEVDKGAPVAFGKTIIAGNVKTRPIVIERELIHKEGEPMRSRSLSLERQKLYKLGLFKEVDVEPSLSYDGKQDVTVKVEESKPGSIEFGVGYGEYEHYRGFLDIGYRNLFGLNKQASLRFEVSSLETRMILNYFEPWFLDRPLQFRTYFLAENRDEKNIDTGEISYSIERYSANTGVEKKLTEKIKADLYYEFALVRTFNVKSDVILSKEDTGTLAISSVRPGITYDSRDNPLDPRKGIFTGLSVKVATGALFSETDFVKVIAHGSTYKALGRRFVLALSLRGGAAIGFKDTSQLPIIERFFLGGRSTVRGYEQDMLGPRSNLGNPLGGNAFLLGNLELRTKVYKGWGVVTFVDAGNVWPKVDDVDPTEIKFTVGAGLRYNTPVGPLRIDYGHKLEREAGESSGALHFSIGHAF